MHKIFQTSILILFVLFLASCNNKHYDITDFGAVTDSTVVNTEAIQKAIDKCAEDGGGTVVVPAGTFITGAIFFKQGTNLEIEAGGVLKGTTNMAGANALGRSGTNLGKCFGECFRCKRVSNGWQRYHRWFR